jgi:P4 family phage/plasmid primase-like protien
MQSHHRRQDLEQFLAARKTSQSSMATMTAMGETRGKWIISDEDYPKFIDLLHEYLFVNRGRCMNLVERPRQHEPKPLLIDLDFRYPDDTSLTRFFTLDHIETFVQTIITGFKVFFDIEPYSELRFFVTLRPSPYSDKGVRKDGVHIMCPDIALTNEKQAVLRNWIMANEGVQAAFKDTGYTNPVENVYDESMTRQQGWIFYGESKPNIAPYKLEAVFNYKPNDDEWMDEAPSSYSARDLMELLSVRYNIVPDLNTLKDEEATALYNSLLHKRGGTAEQAPANQEPAPIPEGLIDVINYMKTPVSEREFGMIRRFVLECLKDAWFEQYDKWIRVGWCLHNIDPSEAMFDLWVEFSNKSGKSANNNMTQLRHDWFHGMRKSGDGPRLLERSLRKWAREDNPAVYKEIIESDILEFVLNEIDGTHFHIAKLMKKMYGNNYIASVNPRTTEWFKYDDEINHWKKINQGIELKSKISVEVAAAINSARGTILRQMGEPNIKQERKEYLDNKMKALLKIEMQLYNNGFTESTMKMATQQFCEEEFMSKLNINPTLLGCRNGVLELRAKDDAQREHVIFRQGRPEDYVSFLAGHNHGDTEALNYVPYDPTDPRQAEITDFFVKLFPRADLRSYTLRLLASCLEGANHEQCYYTLTGGGGNGKSKLVELMRLTLGDYQTSMASTVLTRKRPEAGAANPEIIVTKCKRFIYMAEPDDKEPINTSVMKQFSGEDIIEARALYGDQEKFRIMGKMFMSCNDLPPVSSMDEGTWRRIRVIPFESRFLPPDHPDVQLKRPNIFLRDPKLEEKIRTWREPFLSLLVHIYNTEYLVTGLSPVPEIVVKASNKYKSDFDLFGRFEMERIREPTTTEQQLLFREDPIESAKIRSIFTSWRKENQLSNTVTPDMILTRLTAKYGQPEKNKWSAFKVFTTNDEADDWDKEHARV